MKRVVAILVSLIMLVQILSCRDNKRANNYNKEPAVDAGEALFLKNASEFSLSMVKFSGLAISNSKKQQVIQFAKTMIDAHTQLVTDLKKLRTDNFVTTEDSINAIHRQTIAGLEKRRAGAFDKVYLQEIINEYAREIKQYDFASRNKNSTVADFAQKNLPALKAHLDSAKVVSLSLK